ncbi:MAG: DUF4175 domain-containing protein [Calditrichaeota bacterium]|nr:DUF4175 domain-containing protein [Calditrichota bacterium]
MKALKGFIATLTVVALAAFIPFAVHAQRAGANNQSQQQMMHNQIQQRIPQSMMGNMNQSMMSMNKMMQHMQKIMNTTTNMVQAMHNKQPNKHEHSFDTQMEALVGRDELEKVAHDNKNAMMLDNGNQQTMNMMQGINDMAKNMNKVMEQMHKMMSDQKLMNNPGTRKQMQEMQKHMKSLTNDFDGVVKNMDKIQKGNRQ